MAIQSCLTVVAAFFTYWKLRDHNRTVAIGSSLLIVTSPFLVFYELMILSEVLYVLLVWSGWLLLFSSGRTAIAQAAAAGALLGAAILTRDTLLLLPLFAVPFVLVSANRLEILRKLLVTIVMAYAVVLPWALRNDGLPNKGLEISDGRFGLNLWVGTWERNGDWVLPGLQDPAFPAYAFRTGAEERRLRTALRQGDDNAFRDVALDRIRSEPAAVLRTWMIRYPKLWIGTRSDHSQLRPARRTISWIGLKVAFFALNFVALAVGTAGMLLSLKRKSEWGFFIIPVLYTALIYLPFHNVETRYSLVALPFVYLFATLFMIHLAGPAKGKPGSPFSSHK